MPFEAFFSPSGENTEKLLDATKRSMRTSTIQNPLGGFELEGISSFIKTPFDETIYKMATGAQVKISPE